MISGDIQKESLTRSVPWIAAAFFGTVLLAIGAKVCLEYGLAWKCPAIVLFGLPCPSCGMTRAFAALAEFDVWAALKFNPLIIAGLFALPLLGFSEHVPAWAKRHGWTIFATLVILNWLYVFLFLPR
ncbi:MAG: DUF2752 domain-containing protein [Limisphaerales bacterium]